AEPVVVREFGPGFVDSRVDGAPQVFEKRAEDAAVERRNLARWVNDHARGGGRRALGARATSWPGARSQREARRACLFQKASSWNFGHAQVPPFGVSRPGRNEINA